MKITFELGFTRYDNNAMAGSLSAATMDEHFKNLRYFVNLFDLPAFQVSISEEVRALNQAEIAENFKKTIY